MLTLFILIFFIVILIVPFNFKAIVHNNNIKLYLIIFKIIKFTILDKANFISFKEESISKFKSNRIYKIFAKKIKKDRNYFEKINIFKILKRVFKFIKVSLDLSLKFGFERKDITAITYGMLSASLPIFKVALSNFISKEEFRFKLFPDFNNNIIDFKVSINIKTNLFKVILIIFIIFKETLIIRKNYKNK